MAPKPAFHAMNTLINNEWKTRLTLKADANGKVAFRGFKGTYRVSWKDAAGAGKQAEFRLVKDGDGI